MCADGTACHHVLIKLPDGNYFDGGYGVLRSRTYLKQYLDGTRIEEMIDFDLERLDRWSYGLKREYGLCPNYSDKTTARIIKRHLAMLPKEW